MDKKKMMTKAQLMIREVTNLPTIPVITTRVATLLDNPDVELEEVAEMILTDQVIASRVIKVVNSPLFKPMHAISSLKRALIYLGFRRIREIALTCSIIKAFEGKDGAFDIRSFWQHSFGVGIVSKIIAQRVRYPEVEKAYICGIVHDIGEVFFSNYMKNDFQKIIDSIRGTSNSFIDAEAMVFGTTHCEIGLCLAKKWNFPLEYCDVIAHHHAPESASLDPMLVAIVNLADNFCSVRHMDYGGREWSDYQLSSERAWSTLQRFYKPLSMDAVEDFCGELDRRVPEIQELVDSVFEGVS